ncbi:uncharacterized protein LOC107040088 [Diachasma alloeum]|uniref:uncharacterized protein LOC107040088 n=1 Tax=Diachasma alloeum TaxID=454923 RepID=UPI0007384A8B|nr:uncharacterized protein LOC107040088 [Diachasma alloeum]
MRWSLLLSLLVAIQPEFSVFAKTGEANVGGNFTFEADAPPKNVTLCRFKHDKLVYNIYPNPQDRRIRHLGGNNCSFQLTNVHINDDGKWEIWTYGPGELPPSAEPIITEYDLEVLDAENSEQMSAESTPPTESQTKPTTESTGGPTTNLTAAPTTKWTPTPTTKSTAPTQPPTPPPTPVEKQKLQIGFGVNMMLDHYELAQRCIVLHNNILYEIYPKMNLTDASFEQAFRCRFQVDHINWEHTGNWTLTGFFPGAGNNFDQLVPHSIIYEISAYEKVGVQPATEVSMNSGYATFYLPKTFENPTSCRITNKGETFELLGQKIDSSEDIEPYKTCGVRMRYDKQREGTWTIIQSRGDSQEIIGSFTIHDAKDPELPKIHHQFWTRGAPESLQVGTPSFHQVTYCDIVRPDGVVIPLSDPECKYEVNATDKHAGTWKGRYGVDHSMKLFEEDFIVEVWDSESVEISVTTEGDRVTMLCRTGLKSLKNCMFQSPNGTVFTLQGGMGDGNYEYYGRGFTKEPRGASPKRAECGLTIREPSPHDYGVWKCSMKKFHESNMKKLKEASIHGLIDVPNPKQKDLTGDIVSSPAVYVKRGDPFTIRCTTNAPLNFCWMRSPNGTMYSVTKSGSGGNLLSYNGEGLSMGVCGARVENADDTDNGDWSCQLGVVGAAEVKSIVPVTVTESELIPRAESISAYPGKPTVLSCHTLPSSEATIDYCRWVRPNGHGIYRDTVSRYVSQRDNTTCTLRLNAVAPEDLGTWMCFARLKTGSDREVSSRINLKTETAESAFVENTALHIVAIVLLVTTIICTAFMIMSLYRRKNRRTPTSPGVYQDTDDYLSKNVEIKVLPYFNNLKTSQNSFKQ